MTINSAAKKIVITLTVLFLMIAILVACNIFPGSNDPVEIAQEIKIPVDPAQESDNPKESDVIVSSIEEPLVIVDYSKYSIIGDKEFYKNKFLGEIFIIKDWKTEVPISNSLTIFGKVPLAIHPDQPIEAMEFKNPNQPVIVTGAGEGWAKVVFRGKGTGGSSICTGEITTSFRLIGGFYPAPRCTLDVDIITTYSLEPVMMRCVYDTGLELELPMDEWVDPFTDVKLPIVFTIPDGYEVPYKKTENNVTYDLSYYLYNFWGSPPSKSKEELDLLFGDTPPQFYETGCQTVHLALNSSYLPEGMDTLPDVWDLMLTPESKREQSQP